MRLQSQPDGLMAAMALIEAQNLLRQQDSFAYSQWQLQAQMQVASAPAEVAEPEPRVAEPDPVIVPAATPVVSQAPVVPPAPVSPAAPVAPPVSAVPTVAQESSVDEIVAALNRNYVNAETKDENTENEASPPLSPPVPALAPETKKISFDQLISGEEESVADEPPAPAETSVQTEPTEGEVETRAAGVARTKTSAALSWSWISIASSPLVFVLAAFLKESGASLAQSLVVIAGLIVTTAVLAGIGSVAAKRGSSPIGVVSRAAFGVWGNVLPAVAMLLVKITWSIALLIFAARILSPLLASQPWFAVISSQFVFPAEFTALMLTTIPMVMISALVAGFGGITMLRSQQLVGAFSLLGILGIGFFVFSTNSILDLQQGELLAAPALIDLAIFSFMFFGFTVFSQSGDFARKLPVETPGAKVFFLSFVSTLFIPLAVGVMGVLWIYMADESFGLLLTDQLIPTIAAAAPIWVFI
jgi:hypothetical protein